MGAVAWRSGGQAAAHTTPGHPALPCLLPESLLPSPAVLSPTLPLSGNATFILSPCQFTQRATLLLASRVQWAYLPAHPGQPRAPSWGFVLGRPVPLLAEGDRLPGDQDIRRVKPFQPSVCPIPAVPEPWKAVPPLGGGTLTVSAACGRQRLEPKQPGDRIESRRKMTGRICV